MRKRLRSTLTISILLILVLVVGCQQPTAPVPPTPTPAPSEPEREYIPNQIIVKFKEATSNEAVEQLNQSLGATVVYTSPSAGFKVLQIPEGKTVAEMVALYSKQAIVEYAEPNYIDYTQPEARERIER